MHCIQGSDAHRLTRDLRDKTRMGIGDRATEILLPEASFQALREVFEGDDFTRTRPSRPVAETPYDHVQAARDQGNTIVQSFHESMSRQGGRLHKVLCDVVALANTRGGTVYVGLSAAKKGEPRGVESPPEDALLLKREIERHITPQLDAHVGIVETMGVPILSVSVPSGPDKPYALDQTRIFVREETETTEAVRDEIVSLVLASQAPAPAPVETPVVDLAATEPAPLPEVELVEMSASQPGPPVSEESSLPVPAIGVEIVSMDERKGTKYFSIRDMRNGNMVQNVTPSSARKLWSYAINQAATNPVDPTGVTWSGSFGLWQVAKRAKRMRYDLVLREPDGRMRVFYGVTSDGMSGPWVQFLQEEDRA
jgi:hypothetical protein